MKSYLKRNLVLEPTILAQSTLVCCNSCAIRIHLSERLDFFTFHCLRFMQQTTTLYLSKTHLSSFSLSSLSCLLLPSFHRELLFAVVASLAGWPPAVADLCPSAPPPTTAGPCHPLRADARTVGRRLSRARRALSPRPCRLAAVARGCHSPPPPFLPYGAVPSIPWSCVRPRLPGKKINRVINISN